MIETISSMKNVPLGRMKMPAGHDALGLRVVSGGLTTGWIRRYALMLLAAKT